MKRLWPTIKRYWLIWLVLIAVVIFVGSMAVGEFQRWWELRGAIGETEEDIQETQENIEELHGELELVTDPAYLEKEARRTLNVKREGEEVFAVVGLSDAKQEENFSLGSTTTIESGNEVWENVKSWYYYFFGK